jgi:hypothetical protein
MPLRLDLDNYHSCPQYNQWLDDQHAERSGTLDILSFQPRPSFVLYSLSQDTYQAAFADFQLQWQDQLKESVFEEFPSPIAHYFYRFENGYENELQRLHLLRDTWESIVDVLHALAVSECSFHHMSLSTPISFSNLLSDSVAQRLWNLEQILDNAKTTGVALETLQIVSSAIPSTMRGLNQTRNAFSHSAAQSELQARTWIGECYEDVIDVLDELRPLAGVELFRYLGQVDSTTLRCEVFRGHGFTRTIRNITLTVDQARDSQRYFRQGQVLVSLNGIIFGARPLIYYREDTSGHTTKLCLFRKTRGDAPNRRIEYEVVGESVRYDEDRLLFKDDLDQLRNLFGLGPD